jgi:hypothetical protein
MEIKEYIMNQEHRLFLGKKIRSFRQTKYLGPFAFLGLNFLFVTGFRLEFNNALLLYAILSTVTTALCVVLAQNALLKLNKIVTKVVVLKDEISLETEVKKITLPRKDARFISGLVTVIDKDRTALIVAVDGISFQVIADFSDTSIVDELRMLNQS